MDWPLVGFLALIAGLLALDLGVFHRGDRALGVRASLGWTLFYVALALVFGGVVYLLYKHGVRGAGGPDAGRVAAIQYLTAWILEKTLSLDNILVIALIFASLAVPAHKQHRVLFWGILGALALRGIMITVGAVLLTRFAWIAYVFGAVLLLTAARLLALRHERFDVERSVMVRIARRFYPVGPGSDSFFTRQGARRVMTPLFVSLLAVEGADVVFAVDSIPACLAITRDPFLVFTSNVFAMLGLRSLYFALAALLPRFRYLKASLVFLLAYVAVKMILAHHVSIPAWVSLSVIAGILAVGVLASVIASSVSRRTARRA